MECMMRLKIASASIVISCLSMLSACDINRVGTGDSAEVTAIGDASTTLIAATSDPCKPDPGDLFGRPRGGQQAYEQRCEHTPPD
jgi:hypothetical protein